MKNKNEKVIIYHMIWSITDWIWMKIFKWYMQLNSFCITWIIVKLAIIVNACPKFPLKQKNTWIQNYFENTFFWTTSLSTDNSKPNKLNLSNNKIDRQNLNKTWNENSEIETNIDTMYTCIILNFVILFVVVIMNC